MTYQTGFETTIAFRVEPTDTTIKLATAPTATNGRLYIFNNAQEEWVSYTGVSGTSVTGVTRDLSKTADPATAGTGKTWIAGTTVRLVAMHDQMPDKKDSNVFTGTQTFTTVNFGSTGKFSVPVYADTTARDAAIASPTNGMVVYVTASGSFFKYEGGAWSTFASGSVPNATTTTAGKVELATQAEVEAGTDTGGTGASLVATPGQLNPNNITTATPVSSDKILFSDVSDSNKLKSSTLSMVLSLISIWYFGDGSDGDVTISTNTTLTRDMYYNNLVINSGITLDPAGYKIFVKNTISGTGTIARVGNAGGDGSYGIGGVAGTTQNQGSMSAELPAGKGGDAHTAGTGGGGTNPGLTTTNGSGGGSGGGSTFFPQNPQAAGGGGGVCTRGPLYNKVFAPSLVHPATVVTSSNIFYNYGSCGAAGGGGGGATVTSTGALGGGGGGGGGNGGTVFISCLVWNFTGTVDLRGGKGGNGGNGVVTTGGGGGGGGGNGGTIVRIYGSISNEATFTLTGGAGGTGGTGNSSGANGTAGSTGTKIDILI